MNDTESLTPARTRDDLLEEYRALSTLEQETTEMRHNTFTALISISFILTGLSFRGEVVAEFQVPLFGEVTTGQLASLFGFMFYCFTILHYSWYHRYSHRYRDALKQLELQLGFSVYRQRKRPTVGRAKFHFDWSLYIMGVIYFISTGLYAGWLLLITMVLLVALMYALMLIWSIRWDEEPLEEHSSNL